MKPGAPPKAGGEEQGLSHAAGGNGKWYRHCGKGWKLRVKPGAQLLAALLVEM